MPNAIRDGLIETIQRLNGPNDFFQLVVTAAELRSQSFLHQLRDVAGSSRGTSVLRAAARLLGSIHSAVERSDALTDLSSLATLAAEHPLVLREDFESLLRAFNTGNFQRAIALRDDANRMVGMLNQFNRENIEEVPSELLEDGFLAWLCALASDIEEREERKGVYVRVEFLEHLGRGRRAAPPLELRGRNAGYVRISTPVPASVSEAWYYMAGEGFLQHSRALTEAFFSGGRSWRETVRDAHERTPVRFEAPTSTTAFISCALLRNALVDANPTQARNCLGQFRAILDQAPMDALSAPERNSYVLRYALAVLPSLGALEDRQATLEDLVTLLDRVIAETSRLLNPGLMRDALLSRARTRRELTRWTPAELERAIADFRAGLDVSGARYAREARGRALGDLGGALMARTNRTIASEAEIQRLLTDAVSWCDGFPRNRATALRNHAVFLNERAHGDRSENQERALAYINSALAELAPSSDSAEDSGDSDGGEGLEVPEMLVDRELRAVTLQTRGNILRARQGGSRVENRREAMESYRAALTEIGSDGFEGLRCDLRFCIATAHLDDGDPQSLDHARHNLEEARRLAQTPAQHGRIRRAQAAAWLASDGPLEQLPGQLLAAEESLQHFTDVEDPAEQARAMATLAELLLIQPDAFAKERAARLLSRAADLFANHGDLNRAGLSLQDLAAVRLGQWRATPGGKDLLRDAGAVVERALTHFDRLHRATIDPFGRNRLSERIGMLRAEHLWIEAQLGAPAARLWSLSAAHTQPELEASRHLRAVERRLPSSESVEVTLADRLLGAARGDYANARARARSNADLAEQIFAIRLAQQDLADTLSNAGEAEAARPRAADAADEIRIEFHVAALGTVILCSGPELPAEGLVRLLSFSGTDLMGLLGGDGTTTAWLPAYEQRVGAPSEWERAWVGVLGVLQRELMEPILRTVPLPTRTRQVTLVPGALGSLPLHAVPDSSGAPWSDSAASLVTVPAPRFARRHGPRSRIRRALCVLSNPSSRGNHHLLWVVREIAEVAELLASAGVETHVVASSGADFGRRVFDRQGLRLPDAVRVAEGRPTPIWFQEHARDCDFLLFSGHGSGGVFGESGLVLVDDNGAAANLAVSDMWGASRFSTDPVVVLNACETAVDASHLVGESSSLVSSFLRLGASHVIGTLWAVADDVARAHSVAFVRSLLETGEPGRAHLLALAALRAADPRVTRWAPFTCWSA